jgi:hypothetical protein
MRRGLNLRREESEDEEEVEDSDVEEEEEEIDQDQMQLIRSISKIGKRPKVEVPSYCRSINPEELIDWINELEEYFEYEEIKDPDRVKLAKRKMKIHANIWWKEVQMERNQRGKGKIIRWDQMVEKMKKQFIPMDYELDQLKKLQGLRQGNRSVKEYIEDFHKVIIRIGHIEANKEKVARYLNGL